MSGRVNCLVNCLVAAAVAGYLASACSVHNQTPAANETMTMELTSAAFANGQPIPQKYTCQGSGVSPPLAWSNAPANAMSFALIADDPDAPMGTWVHWVLYDLPPTAKALAENTPRSPVLAEGAKQGLNDFKTTGYGGPCPPPGKAHRYFFKLYALDTTLTLKPGATKKELLQAMEGHILAEGQLMGKYQRR